jgi:hypothetical protein
MSCALVVAEGADAKRHVEWRGKLVFVLLIDPVERVRTSNGTFVPVADGAVT